MRTVSVVIGLLLLTGAVVGTRVVYSAPAAINVILADYEFRPGLITARPGQTVTIMLANASVQKKPHEFMVGREVTTEHGGRAAGYKRDFFERVAIRVSSAKGIWRFNEGVAKVLGEVKPEMGGMTMPGHGGFMVELKAEGAATLTFTVPADRIGDWEIGCFSEAGDHYVKGMKGKLTVVKP